MAVNSLIFCFMLLTGVRALHNCVNGKCTTGYECAIIDCIPEKYDPDVCGEKCLGPIGDEITEEPTTKREPLVDCVDLKCPDGYVCAAIDCLIEKYDPDYCGMKCLGVPTEEPTTEAAGLEDCINGECTGHRTCVAIDCTEEGYDPTKCGMKCLYLPA